MVGVGVGRWEEEGVNYVEAFCFAQRGAQRGRFMGASVADTLSAVGLDPARGPGGAVSTQSSTPWCTAAANRTRGPVHKMLKRPSA